MIGIVTFHFAYNYGAMLQAYALNKYINNNIGDCKIINYRPAAMQRAYRIAWKDTLHNPKSAILKLRRAKQENIFEKFIKEELKCGESIKEIKTLDDTFDIFVTGSDQVWNTDITHNDLNYFLQFVDSSVRRVSYGASVGNSELVQNYSSQIVKELEKFHFISCREKSAAEAIRSKIDLTIDTVVDPTLLLPMETWSNLCRKPNTNIPQKFILYYSLSENKTLIREAEELAKEYAIPILSIHPLVKKWKINGSTLNDVGPREFLWLVNNAEYVCTDSFHGSVFSVIFKKKCVLSAHSKLGERNKQLLDLVNLDQESFGKEIDFSCCDYSSLNSQIKKSEKFLYRALK